MIRTRAMESMAMIGHELRTPISGVMGVTDLLLTTNLDGEQREYLQAIRSSAELLLRMSNDLMELSRLSAGPIPSESVQFSLRKTVHLVVQPLRSVAARKGLKLCYSVDFDVPDRLTGDPERLGQLLVNLIGNAIQFTERGEILVNVEREESNESEARVKFTVSDTGIGISPEKIGRIFEPYFQAAGSERSRGMGLGLAIATRLAESMRGRIWADSQPGEGSQFHFTCDFGLAEAPSGRINPTAIEALQASV